MPSQDHLKVFMEQPGFSVGCCDLHYGAEEMESFPLSHARVGVGRLLVNIRERYGASLRVDLIDPRNIISLFDLFRYRVNNKEPVWILNGSLIFRGVPEWETLREKVDLMIGQEQDRGLKD